MELHGKNLIGWTKSALGGHSIRGYDPKAGHDLGPAYAEATAEEIHWAGELAAGAFTEYRTATAEQVAAFLEAIATNILDLGDGLIERASQESGLPKDRITGERGRTVGQLRMFAALVLEGSWVDARIDPALPDRKPLPRPDLRRMLIPIGPVAIWGASNFPLAFSVAGGDTASAFAARNPVVFKAHPAHPGASEMVGRAIVEAARACGFPEGTFSLLHGAKPETSLALVRHPAIQAGAFTGSLRAGRALFDAASQRTAPIPFYAEMGSVNPVFVLPGALKEGGETIAQGLKNSVTLGVGQFCTNPGVVAGLRGDGLDLMITKLRSLVEAEPPGTMLYPGILRAYQAGVGQRRELPGVRSTSASQATSEEHTEAGAVVFETDAESFQKHEILRQELFGPSTVVVSAGTPTELEEIARNMEGSLTATVHATAEDLSEYRGLISLLATKVGRLLFNGYPTGVEVSPAMNHGGPYPATADPKFTSVGTAAICRFVRPICYQNAPPEVLPPELLDGNPLGIWRMFDGTLGKA
ncbi:MAG TPA: aldehyde dehydrogenase (NADP(+)) [Bryobacteraceae bacterium]|jgi:NADP-dependent aldehyde dehydrogenase|nr:aldehyde dehydrogenase (NADP(+)) [Bryobacteraceae bacterium]